MQANLWTSALIVISALSCGFACSNSDDDKKDSTPVQVARLPKDSETVTENATTQGATVACEDSWKTYVTGHPKGLLLSYSTVSQASGADASIIKNSKSSFEDWFLQADETQVLSTRTMVVEGIAQPVVSKVVLTKAQWLKSCNQLNSILSKVNIKDNVEIMEKGPQSVQVSAGSFAAEYINGRTNAPGSGPTTFQNWTLQDGSGIMVKTVIETTNTVGDGVLKMIETTELTRILRP